MHKKAQTHITGAARVPVVCPRSTPSTRPRRALARGRVKRREGGRGQSAPTGNGNARDQKEVSRRDKREGDMVGQGLIETNTRQSAVGDPVCLAPLPAPPSLPGALDIETRRYKNSHTVTQQTNMDIVYPTASHRLMRSPSRPRRRRRRPPLSCPCSTCRLATPTLRMRTHARLEWGECG